MTTAAPAPKRPARPAAKPQPPTVRQLITAMGCKPGCRCACNRPMCACLESKTIPTEPSAAARAMGARVTIRKAAA